ncbi:MAG: M20/M25/M40 family metallo-hydrolase [Oligoflexia bacterium]|nr:M20/M25/M40 family metallo-hydrolase [Oligoflexia bacterium]
MEKSVAQGLYDQKQDQSLTAWKELLRFRSISVDPACQKDSLDCAAWLKAELEKQGLQSRLLETRTKPVVYAEFAGLPGAPTVLFYGHYDVQPVDPVAAWDSPPFDPVLRGDRLYARGAQDNKGQLTYFIQAVGALIGSGRLKCSLKVVLEGEEESSSTGISEALPGWGDLLKADLLMVCDTGMYRAGVPAITMGLRGTLHATVKLGGLRCDLHSGIHGGVVKNPATEMARLIATLHNSAGEIVVPGYLDQIEELRAEDLKLAQSEPFDAALYEGMVGVPPLGGENGRSFVERRGLRPTIEINGISAGYNGPGIKTIIPAEATCKITSRLVKGQDPAHTLKLLLDHIGKNAPTGLKLEIPESGVGGPAVLVSSASRYVKRAGDILRLLSQSGAVSYVWEGASIPVISLLSEVSGAEPLLVGFGLEEDNIHAPNESFSIEQFRQGFMYVAMFLDGLS